MLYTSKSITGLKKAENYSGELEYLGKRLILRQKHKAKQCCNFKNPACFPSLGQARPYNLSQMEENDLRESWTEWADPTSPSVYKGNDLFDYLTCSPDEEFWRQS